MSERNGPEILKEQNLKGGFVSIGLDSDPRIVVPLFPKTGLKTYASPTSSEMVITFNQAVLEHTADILGAIKINPAFYKFLGRDCFSTIEETVSLFFQICPQKLLIIDNKYGDVPHSMEGHAWEAFEEWHADSATISPYLGRAASKPSFLDRDDKLIFILSKTSNLGSEDLQNLAIHSHSSARYNLYQRTASLVSRYWNEKNNCGLVVGARVSSEAQGLRRRVGPNLPFLSPGIDAQGGGVAEIVKAAFKSTDAGLINSSRGIIFPNDIAEDEKYFRTVRRKALSLQQKISFAQNF